MPYSFHWSVILKDLPELARGLHLTFEITAVALVAGFCVGVLLALFRLSRSRLLSAFAQAYVTAFRAVPMPVVLLVFFLVVPQLLSALLHLPSNIDIRRVSALIAFSLFEAAYYAEIIRAGVNSVPAGQVNAALALGMTPFQCTQLIVLPLALRAIVPLLLTQAIILFQDTSLVYVIGLGDFFTIASNIGARDGTTVELIVFAGACYFCVCTALSAVVRQLQARFGVVPGKGFL
ncbi:amino acid ABC transporter permease [Burkholderia sp. WAC0059]|uniref:ABC transporter permease subunit n=1 Tax=Burkholderia sp. WAC0059 TaxID=2066022 RepID=UPI000C7ECB20|nr:ABC transporter permease subunit [Burkholderia sp. WAC0059]PLZ02995.1 amino acid ABC transporter permease [Burkholderia sp. WAC0059]